VPSVDLKSVDFCYWLGGSEFRQWCRNLC